MEENRRRSHFLEEEAQAEEAISSEPTTENEIQTASDSFIFNDRRHFQQELPRIIQAVENMIHTQSQDQVFHQVQRIMLGFLPVADDPLAKSISNIFQFVCFVGMNSVLSYIVSSASFDPGYTLYSGSVSGLCLAAAQGHLAVCLTLLKHRIMDGFTSPDTSGRLAVEYAIERGRLDAVRFLLDHGLDINTQTSQGTSLLYYATKIGQVLIMEELLFRGVDVNSSTQQNPTIFEIAVSHDNMDVFVMILPHMSTTGVFEKSAVAAVSSGALGNIRLLLQKAKELGIRLSLSSLLGTAASKGQNTICSFLVESGADINSVRANGITALFRAIRGQHLSTCKLLIQLGANIEHKCHAQRSPLHYACGIGNNEIVSLLLDNCASFENPDSTGFRPLHYADHVVSVSCCDLLVRKGANINSKQTQQMTALHWASYAGHHDTAKFLLSAGAQVDPRDADGSTPLLWASEHGHIECIRTLLQARADINVADNNGISPLFTACNHGHDKIVNLLVEFGANIKTTDLMGRNCLHIAAERGQISCIQNLLRRNVDLNTKDMKGRLPVHYAAMSGSLESLLLLFNPHNANIQDSGGMTPFHWAVQAGLSHAIPHFLKNGARLDIYDAQHNDPLLVALKSRNLKCAAMLVESGANVQTVDALKQTPLHMAAYIGNAKFVLLLLQNGAQPDFLSSEGYSPIHLAASEGHLSAIEVLSQYKANILIKDNHGRTAFDYATAAGHVHCLPKLIEMDSINAYHKPTALDDEIGEIVMGFVKEGSAVFNVKSEKDSINTILLTPRKLKLQKNGKTKYKDKYTFSIEVMLHQGNEKEFSITLDGRKMHKLIAENPTQRYIIAMSIRIFRIYSLKPKPLVVAIEQLSVEDAKKSDKDFIHSAKTAHLQEHRFAGSAIPNLQSAIPQHPSTGAVLSTNGTSHRLLTQPSMGNLNKETRDYSVGIQIPVEHPTGSRLSVASPKTPSAHNSSSGRLFNPFSPSNKTQDSFGLRESAMLSTE